MQDGTFDRVITALGIILGLYFFYKQNANASASAAQVPSQFVPVQSANPQLVDYINNFGGNGPISISGGNTTIDVQNQGLGYLSNKVMPMFGFVGMASNAMYQ